MYHTYNTIICMPVLMVMLEYNDNYTDSRVMVIIFQI